MKRPDILHDDGTRKDYYEIKPQSPTGIPDGMIKLVEIVAFMKGLSLPYKPGTVTAPTVARVAPAWPAWPAAKVRIQQPVPSSGSVGTMPRRNPFDELPISGSAVDPEAEVMSTWNGSRLMLCRFVDWLVSSRTSRGSAPRGVHQATVRGNR